MGDEPVGDRDDDEEKSVTVKMTQSELDKLEERMPDEFNDSARVRRAVWLVNNASSIDITFDANEQE
ncbi:hypothetical protein [Halomontanus rarus]|uniref:hypothetical protein n=1 Tax=Halomontanus rarus TaxID=3034020 RepID=UPI0023E86048|nr:hypothetical protein [Halovivax sp. TS33]